MRCPNCSRGLLCENCEEGVPKMCFDFCDFNDQICAAQKTIDFNTWQETYAAVRCLRNRKQQNDLANFPGFCRQHNREGDFVRRYWAPLGTPYKHLMYFMITADRCGLQNIDYYIRTEKDDTGQLLFRAVTLWNVLNDVLFTPPGIMAVDPIYFNTFLVQIVEKEQERVVFSDPRLLDYIRRVMNEGSDFDADGWIRQFSEKFSQQRMDYGFVADAVFQPANLEWLNAGGNRCSSLLNWNMLVHKLTIAFTFCFYPVEFRPSIPYFASNWREVWASKMGGVQDPGMREDFLTAMDIMVRTIEETSKDVPLPDPRPEPNVYKFVSACKK